MSFFEKSLNTLELPAVLEMLAQQAVGEAAKERALALTPATDRFEVSRRIEETSAAKTMMTVRGGPSFSGVKDVRASLARADLGGALNTRELLDIARVLQCARLVRGYIGDDSVGKTAIDALFYALRANKFLEEKINTSIVGEEEIADGASPELATIRRQMRAAAARARDALQKILSSPSYAKALQEPIITMRADRYVVPVRADHKGAVPGLVHDISATGQTLFVEPMAAVKANNELRELAAKEKLEIERILAELSADCAEHREDIDSDFELLTRLDLIFAKAKLSYKLDCQEAAGETDGIVLRHARHPLLDQFFFSFPENDMDLLIDCRICPMKGNTLLHIPLGSNHGVIARGSQKMHYLWIDCTPQELKQQAVDYLNEVHKPTGEKQTLE